MPNSQCDLCLNGGYIDSNYCSKCGRSSCRGFEIDIEGVESALALCIKTLKILHPIMDEKEPCIAYEAYSSAKWALRHLEQTMHDAAKEVENLRKEKKVMIVAHQEEIERLRAVLNGYWEEMTQNQRAKVIKPFKQ